MAVSQSKSPLKQTDGRVTVNHCSNKQMAESKSPLKQISIISATAAPSLNQRPFLSQSPLKQAQSRLKTYFRVAVTTVTKQMFHSQSQSKKEPTELQRKTMEKQYCAAYEDGDDENDDERRESATVVGRCLEIKSGICLPLQSLVQKAETECSKGGNNIIAPAVFLQSGSPWDERVQLNKTGLYIP